MWTSANSVLLCDASTPGDLLDATRDWRLFQETEPGDAPAEMDGGRCHASGAVAMSGRLNRGQVERQSVLKGPLPTHTSLHLNAFARLGVSVHDDRRTISARVEEIALTEDDDVCARAKNDLLSSRHRLLSELGWLPGVPPAQAAECLQSLHTKIDLLRGQISLPALAHANLMAAAFELLSPETRPRLWCEWIIAFAGKVEEITAEDVRNLINGDREHAGFPPIGELEAIESALKDRHRHYCEVVLEAVEAVPSDQLITIITTVVEITTRDGDRHAPQLVHDLVDRYETYASQFLDPEAENIRKLVAAVTQQAAQGEGAIQSLIDRLEALVRRWDRVAQPVQVSNRARGLADARSQAVAVSVLSLSLDLVDKHGMRETGARLHGLVADIFSEVREIEDLVRTIREKLDEMAVGRHDSAQREKEWAAAITYEKQVGFVFKRRLRISPAGVEWKGRVIALEEIKGVRWGALRHFLNGIPTGTSYTIKLATGREVLEIDPTSKAVLSAFVERLWGAVCTRLIREMLDALRRGSQIRVGAISFDDNGVFLTRAKFIGSEQVYLKWVDVRYRSEDGAFHLVAKDNERVSAQARYLDTDNVHLLEAAIRKAFENWKGTLSASSG